MRSALSYCFSDLSGACLGWLVLPEAENEPSSFLKPLISVPVAPYVAQDFF